MEGRGIFSQDSLLSLPVISFESLETNGDKTPGKIHEPIIGLIIGLLEPMNNIWRRCLSISIGKKIVILFSNLFLYSCECTSFEICVRKRAHRYCYIR